MINSMTIKPYFCTIYAVIIAIIYKTRTFMRRYITTFFCATLKRWKRHGHVRYADTSRRMNTYIPYQTNGKRTSGPTGT